MDWQPIETAPKDGTEILAAEVWPSGGMRCNVIRWLDRERLDLAGEPIVGVSGWYISDGHNDPIWCRHWPYLTHWMPLPDAPAALFAPAHSTAST